MPFLIGLRLIGQTSKKSRGKRAEILNAGWLGGWALLGHTQMYVSAVGNLTRVISRNNFRKKPKTRKTV